MNIVGILALGGLVINLLSCQPKSSLNDVSGDIKVLIPKPNEILGTATSSNVSQYSLQSVQLNRIKVLKEVRGDYAEFFYAPGTGDGQLFGNAPKARFLKDRNGTFLPIDVISSQMATIYFHLQNLIEINLSSNLGSVTQVPFQIGIEVRKSDDVKNYEKNNAFYDGSSNSILFLPIDSQELALSLNAGIIAHEFFHSIFYKKVLKRVSIDPNLSQSSLTEIFNLVYLRGLNEGLADFWGWLYTKDRDFMKYSFARFTSERSLSLQADQKGQFKTQADIKRAINLARVDPATLNTNLMGYIYDIGTPHARFLREIVELEKTSDKTAARLMYEIGSDDKKWIGIVIDFLDDLATKAESLKTSELAADSLFQFIQKRAESEELMNLEQCDLLLAYLVKEDMNGTVKSTLRENSTCHKKIDGYYEVSIKK